MSIDILRAFAEGRIHHLNNGLCPDVVSGHESRDPDCVVCRALAKPDDKAQPVVPNFTPPPLTEMERGYTDREAAIIRFCLMQMCDLSDQDWRDHGFRRSTFDNARRKFIGVTFVPQSPAEQPSVPSDLGAHYRVEFDGFVGTVIGSYKRLDGEDGVVMQQDGCKVVHVYRRKWLTPVEPLVERSIDDLYGELGKHDAARKLAESLGYIWSSENAAREVPAEQGAELSDYPPLPEPAYISHQTDSVMRSYEIRSYSDRQMHEYVDADRVARGGSA